MPFSGQFSFPSKLDLRSGKDGIKLYRWPIKEIDGLYLKSYQFRNHSISGLSEKLNQIKAELIDLSISFKPMDSLKIFVRGLDITYDPKCETIEYENSKIPAPAINHIVKLRLLLDRTSLELFVNEGAAVATFLAVPDKNNLSISLSGNLGAKIESIAIHELKSSWNEIK